jgi:hypothetical protein
MLPFTFVVMPSKIPRSVSLSAVSLPAAPPAVEKIGSVVRL